MIIGEKMLTISRDEESVYVKKWEKKRAAKWIWIQFSLSDDSEPWSCHQLSRFPLLNFHFYAFWRWKSGKQVVGGSDRFDGCASIARHIFSSQQAVNGDVREWTLKSKVIFIQLNVVAVVVVVVAPLVSMIVETRTNCAPLLDAFVV